MASNATIVTYVESTFGIVDYVVFSGFLCISGAVGIYFSVRGQKNTQDYFLGGRTMRPVPVGISCGVSFMSAVSLIGQPAETYVNGYSIMFSLIPAFLAFFAGCAIISSILHPLGMTSISEYLQRRYKSRVITYSTNVIVLLCILQYMGICMLGCVIAFSSVTGGQVSFLLALVIGCAVGIFYTTIGGMQAVVWTDVIQFGFMLLGILVVIISSIIDTPGGLAEIYRLGVKHGRIHDPVWTPDITVRHTVWGLSLGMFVGWLVWCVQPASVQRLCSTSCKRDAYIVAAIASSIFVVLAILPAWAGLNIFGYYTSRGCDIYAAGWIKHNEIILYYVRERLNYPGMQGVFIAALYSASLSSLSSGLNASSSILWKDTIKPMLRIEVSEMRATLISKIIVVLFGVVAMIWCYTLNSFGGLIMQVGNTIDASMYGAYFAVFLLSVLFVHVTWKGALSGMIAGFLFTMWIGIGSLMSGKADGGKLPSVLNHCAINKTSLFEFTPTVNSTVSPLTMASSSNCSRTFLQIFYSISYEWFGLMCLLVSLVVSLMVTGLTGPRPISEVDTRLMLRWCRPNYAKGKKTSKGDEDEKDEEVSLKTKETSVDFEKDQMA